MTVHNPPPPAAPEIVERLAMVLELLRRARLAESPAELRFLVVNDTHHLAPYRQAALWTPAGVAALSGVVSLEQNAPYATWLDKLCRHMSAGTGAAHVLPAALPEDLRREYAEWLAPFAIWIPAPAPAVRGAGLLLAREAPWTEMELRLLTEWVAGWAVCYASQTADRPRLFERARTYVRNFTKGDLRRLARERRVQIAAAVLLILCFPIRLSVLAPAELAPRRPAVLRSPSDGVIDAVLVEPNQQVKKGQPLFRIDTALIQSQRTASAEALAAAQEEYRQVSQQALTDEKARADLPALAAKLEERRAQADYAAEQEQRATVAAPREGVVMFDDPTTLVGKPVALGERVMRVADPKDVEIEAWVDPGDAIPLKPDAPVRLYLDARPLRPVSGKLRYFGHEPIDRPGGALAYRTRAAVADANGAQVGLKGTARLQGGWSPLIYWVLRRPLGMARAKLGA